MRDILDEIAGWSVQGKSIALATVIQTWGSAPRPVGANMAITADGRMAGSVSGGCVEGAVIEVGAEVLKSGRPQLMHFGVADETAWTVGLACGGAIEVFLHPLDLDKFDILEKEIRGERTITSVVIVRGPESLLGQEMLILEHGDAVGTFGRDLDPLAFSCARSALSDRKPRRVELVELPEPVDMFINVVTPSPTLIVVGGVHIAIPLTALAKTIGYRAVIVDPRRMFGSQARFPDVDQLIQAWPDKAFSEIEINASTAIAMLTHDPKIDDPALIIALNSPAFYIGALGSRKTHAARCQRLLEGGISEAQLNRLHAPIGLDLGGNTPEEVALSVMAEIVKARNSLSANIRHGTNG
ncbi:MAG: XdhC family protein [Chloroflexi bacterium]|nr:XdhC family protein [Chloroflexota bacterium]